MLYNRGMINAMVTVEAIRTAQAKYGKKPLTGEQVRWGIENLEHRRRRGCKPARLRRPHAADQAVLQRPRRRAPWRASSSGTARSGSYVSDWIEADHKMLRPMVEDGAKKYAEEKNITPRDCSKVS